MKIERTKNAANNIIFGFILKLYQILIPFIIRTVMIYFLGVEYLGLDSLFTSILQVLNLAELGVGGAMVFSMYKPIAEDNRNKICALMNLYKLYYRIIGVIVLVLGLIVCPFIPYLIKSNVPNDINIYIVYLLNLIATVFSYWLFAYKNSILQAHQRQDVISKITLCVNTVQYILQIIVVCLFKNYYMYLIILLISQICINIITAYKSNKIYPDYNASGSLNKEEIKEINCRVRDLFTSRIGGIIVKSADSIVISAFLGLTVLAVYQNYYYIITAIIAVVAVIFSACTAGIGNSLIVETREKNLNDLKKFTFIIIWIAGFCSCALLCLYQNFMELWVGKELLLDMSCVICLVVYYFIYEINALLNLYKDAGGIWHKDRFRPLVTAIVNVVLNLILVNYIGLYGVLISTFLSMLFVGMPWIIHNLFTEVFKCSSKNYVKQLIKYVISVFIMTVVIYFLTTLIEGASVVSLILKSVICLIGFNMMFLLCYYKKDEFQETKKMIFKILKRK